MKGKWFLAMVIGILLVSLVNPAAAKEEKSLQDEIIYDLLVDRYFNKVIQNDYEVDSRDLTAFNGGDFKGLASEMQYIKDMGFTMVSIGPVFSTATYDGKQVINYQQLERHFGTEEEFKEAIDKIHELDMKVIIDLPTQRVSKEHVWNKENPEWFIENKDGTMALDTSNTDVQKKLIDRFSVFVEEYEIDGIRLQTADQLDEDFINQFSKTLKGIRDVYVISDLEMKSQSGLDAVVKPGIEDDLQGSYKNFDPISMTSPDFERTAEGQLTRVDSLLSARFTYNIVEVKGFPPTRWKLLMFQLMTMPGIPIVQYGSEIAVNGSAPPESHPILNMGVDEELIDHITNLTSLRNDSEALRAGETEVLHETDGWLVYKRSNREESWIIAINNSSTTKSLTLPAEVVGDEKEMRGLFENQVVRQNDDGTYQITVDRELGEAFNVIEPRGINLAYFAALTLVVTLFLSFLFLAWRRGKKRDSAKANKSKSSDIEKYSKPNHG